MKLLNVLFYLWEAFIFGKISLCTCFHVDLWINFHKYSVFVLIFFYFLCSENYFSPCFIAFCFMGNTESYDPINVVLSTLFVLEKYPYVNELSWGNYQDSFITEIHQLDLHWLIDSDLLQYFVIADNIIDFLLNLLASYHVFVSFVKTGKLECI
jgi:hypothetical protein